MSFDYIVIGAGMAGCATPTLIGENTIGRGQFIWRYPWAIPPGA